MIQKTSDYISWLKTYIEETYKTPILENFLNLQILDIKKGEISYSCTLKNMHSSFYGFAHGGALASICDIAMGMSCITLDKLVVTIDMNISYIKNVRAGETIIAKGKVISAGKTIMRAACEIYYNEQLLVKSQASYFVKGAFRENNI